MPVIQTERLVLRPLTTNDFSAFRQFAADAELTRYMLFYPQETESETKAFLQHAEQAWTEQCPEAYEFAILQEDTLIGTITVEYMGDTQGMLGWILRRMHKAMAMQQKQPLQLCSGSRNSCPIQNCSPVVMLATLPLPV